MKENIAQQLRDSAELKLTIADSLTESIRDAASRLVAAYRAGGKLLLFGNGGSAADAQHIAAEMTCRLQLERPSLAALALTTNTSVLTAQANDHGYHSVFARQVQALGHPGDVILAISTSGQSANVLEGVRAARSRDLVTIALTGGDGGELAHMVDLALVVPSNQTPRIQEAHITIGHILCDVVERSLFGE